MDDVRRFCVRMLGDGPAAHEAGAAAGAESPEDRMAALRAAVAACRAGDGERTVPDADSGGDDLAGAVAAELARATAALPAGPRETLALRDLLGLSYEEVAEVAGVPAGEVPLRLAAARLALRAQLRGTGAELPPCDERERGLRTIARRQDGESVAIADEDWLLEHLGHCSGCRQAHSAMLEASACYRAWAPDDAPATGAPA